MSTFREVVYMVLDNTKLSNDDAYVEPEHVLYIISRLRAYLLTSKYQKMKAQLSNTNMQTITTELEPFCTACSCDDSGMYMVRSTVKIPNLLLINNYEGLTNITPPNTFGCTTNTTMNFVNQTRFNCVGYNKWLRSQIYATIGPDQYLYIKSADSNILDLDSIQISSVFEDAEKAAQIIANYANLECTSGEQPCDIMDMEFPLEEGLIALLIENASQLIYNIAMKPRDIKNSSMDELGSIVNYLNTLLKERYRNRQQTVDND